MQNQARKGALVSVMVPTKNSSRTLGRCLASIRNQTYGEIELIVVDNYSSDDTVAIAEKYGANVYLKGNERTSQLNYGASVARGDYVYRVDSDFLLDPSVVEEAVVACESSKCEGAIIRTISDKSVSYWSRVRSLERNLYQNPDNVAVTFFKRDVFLLLGGFDERLSGFEDYDFHNRFVSGGYRYARINAKELHLGEPQSLAEVVRKHYYYGKDLRLFMKKYPKKSVRQLSPIRGGHLAAIESIDDPSLVVGFATYQFVRYTASLLGMLSSVA